MKFNKQDCFDTNASIETSIEANAKDIRALEGNYFKFWIKRCLDLVVALICLILLIPIFVIIAVSIKLDSPGPIFHKQFRIGLKGTQFRMWKFRTMIANASDLQQTLESKNQAKWSLVLDTHILLQTISVVINGNGSY